MSWLSQQQAAALADITDRRLRQLDHEADPPPREGRLYPSTAFGQWLERREYRKAGRHLLAAFEHGHERGVGLAIWQAADELQALAGKASVDDLWPPGRRAKIAAFRARVAALPNAAEVGRLLADYADWIADEGWQ